MNIAERLTILQGVSSLTIPAVSADGGHKLAGRAVGESAMGSRGKAVPGPSLPGCAGSEPPLV